MAGSRSRRAFGRRCCRFSIRCTSITYLLEFARRGYEELPALADLDPKIGIGLSVVDIKDNEVESADLIASRIENACKVLGEGRIPYIHPDCGFWMLTRSVADRKMQALVEGRDLFYGRKAEAAA